MEVMTMSNQHDNLLKTSRTRFNLNVERVQNLITIFEDLEADNARSRDVLRGAVMLLHASLEDVLRQLLLYRMPSAPVELLTMFFSDRRDNDNPKPDKMNIGELAKLHNVSVADEIKRRMTSRLATSHYNNVNDVLEVLTILGFDKRDVSHRVRSLSLGELMSRRHLIVHRSDREEANVDGANRKRKSHGLPRRIDVTTVTKWLTDVKKLVKYVTLHIDSPPKVKTKKTRRVNGKH